VVNRDPVPATVLDAELPEGLDQIIAKAMAKDPSDRYQRGAEMAREIQVLQKTLGARKQAVASPAGVAAPAPTPQPALGHPLVAAQLLSTVHKLPVAEGPYSAVVDKVRKRSLAGVYIAAGLFIVGLWVISFGQQGVRPRAAVPLPAAEVAPVTPPAAQTTPTATQTVPKAKTTASAAAKTPVPPKPRMPAAKTAASAPIVPPPTASEAAKTGPQPHSDSGPTTRVARASFPAVTPGLPIPRAAALTVSPATLEIEVDHKFAQAHLSIWVDGSLSYTHALEGTDKKHLVVFHHVHGHEIHSMQIAPGKHSLRVEVTSDHPTYDQFATLAGDFSVGRENVLHVECAKHAAIDLSLE